VSFDLSQSTDKLVDVWGTKTPSEAFKAASELEGASYDTTLPHLKCFFCGSYTHRLLYGYPCCIFCMAAFKSVVLVSCLGTLAVGFLQSVALFS
jgi:hypothetical protein